MTETAAGRLAAFATDTQADSIPAAVVASAKLHLLDTIGCGLAAVGVATGGQAAEVALAQGGPPEASVLGAGARTPAALAALANGTRCHGLDFDDTHEAGICHSSTVVAPAALAVGEASRSSGEQVLTAYMLGGEVALRVAVAAADGLYARGFHPTSVCGAFGAAAAACRLLGLGPVETRNALGIVGSFAAGLLEYLSDGSATKPLHAGWAAQAGVQAARLAAAGATGPATVIEGRFGLLASHAGAAEGAALAPDLGERWEIEQLAIKPYPACHFAHAPTWAAAQLAEEHRLAPDDVAELAIRVPAEGQPLVLEPLANKLRPRTPYDAKFSAPFMVAHQLVHGRLDLTAFSSEGIRDPEVLALAARVRAEPLSQPPPSRFAGGLRIHTRAGEQLDRFVGHAPGTLRNPLDESSILSKFRSNVELSVDAGSAAELAEILGAIEKEPSLDRLAAALR